MERGDQAVSPNSARELLPIAIATLLAATGSKSADGPET